MINRINIDDLTRFNELGLLVNKNFLKLFDLEKILESEYDYLFGYYNDKVLVGFIHINKLYETVDIINVVVDENFRKKGIASLLISYVIDYFSDIENILLEVNENNIAAISLYEKNGFYVINKRKNYYGSDTALIMKRDVKNERC